MKSWPSALGDWCKLILALHGSQLAPEVPGRWFWPSVSLCIKVFPAKGSLMGQFRRYEVPENSYGERMFSQEWEVVKKHPAPPPRQCSSDTCPCFSAFPGGCAQPINAPLIILSSASPTSSCLRLPVTTPQINYLRQNPCSGVCFGGNSYEYKVGFILAHEPSA